MAAQRTITDARGEAPSDGEERAVEARRSGGDDDDLTRVGEPAEVGEHAACRRLVQPLVDVGVEPQHDPADRCAAVAHGTEDLALPVEAMLDAAR